MTDSLNTSSPRREPIFRAPGVVVFIVVLILIIYGVTQALDDSSQAWLLKSLAFIPVRLTIWLWPHTLARLLDRANADPSAIETAQLIRLFGANSGPQVWTLVTYAFLHGSWTHVGLNSIWLMAFGPPVARRVGWGRFLALFAAAAIAGALAHWLLNMMDAQPIIGASASDSGMMGAATRFIFAPGEPLSGQPVRIALAPRPLTPLVLLLRERRPLVFIVIWLGTNFIFGAGAMAFGLSEAPVAWVAHIGGFVFGLIAFPLFDVWRD